MKTIFVITQQSPSLVPYLMFGILNLLIIAVGVWALRVVRKRTVRVGIRSVLGFFVVGVLILSLPGLRALHNLSEAKTNFKAGRYTVIEGVIQRYESSNDRFRDCFQIDQSTICIDARDEGPGYHLTSARGSRTLANGVHARLYMEGATIVRVDVADEEAARP